MILKSILIGGLYGALISIPTDLILHWRSPTYRKFGLRGRIFYHTIWLASAANFHTEREVMRFQQSAHIEQHMLKQQLLEQSIENGTYYGEDELIRVGKPNGI